jgi:hypothetical protein
MMRMMCGVDEDVDEDDVVGIRVEWLRPMLG